MESKPTPQKPSGANQEGKKKSNTWVLILLLLLLAGSATFNVLQHGWYSDEKAQKEDAEGKLESCNTSKDDCEESNMAKSAEIEDVIAKLKSARDQREALGLENESLNEKIANLERNVVSLRNLRYKDKAEYDRKIAEMTLEADRYLEQIAQLEKKADSLGVKATELTGELEEMNMENESLQGQVAIASILKAENVQVISENEKGKEDTDLEFKAKNIHKLKVTFTLAENAVAEKNTKDMVLRIIEPSKSVMFHKENGGHSFEMANGKSDFYTLKQMFKFSNSNQRITFLYQKDGEYSDGTYQVELYCEGHKIGRGAFKVK